MGGIPTPAAAQAVADAADEFILGVDPIPDWFMDRVSSDDVRIFGQRGYLTHCAIWQGHDYGWNLTRARGDIIGHRWLQAVMRPAHAKPGVLA